MAFNQFKLDRSALQSRGIFNKYIYETDDTIADVLAQDYFIKSRFYSEDGWSGGVIEISCSDGHISGSINGGSVTVLPSGFNPTTDINIERLFDRESVASTQVPSTTGPANAIVIEFGAAFGGASDPVEMSSAGVFKVNQAGTYRLKVALQFGRTGSSGISKILFRAVINGSQAGRSIAANISNANEEQYIENDTWITVPVGTELQFELMRDAAGNDSGGLLAITPTVVAGSWNIAPTAAIRVERWI